MFAQVVVFGDVRWNSGFGRSQQHAAEGEAGNVLQNIGVLDGVSSGFAPGKRRMAGNQNAGDGEGVEISARKRRTMTAPVLRT